MLRKTCIFLGPSGCGKGTQAGFTKDHLNFMTPETPVKTLVMGDLFRKFWGEDKTLTGELSRANNQRGDLQPNFMQVRMWARFLVDKMTGNEHLLIDGSPRRILDAQMFHEVFSFYGMGKPIIFFIDTDRDKAKDRLIKRGQKHGRNEDVPDLIDKRLDWYEKDAKPAIMFFKDKPEYIFAHIDGNGTQEEVWNQVREYLKA